MRFLILFSIILSLGSLHAGEVADNLLKKTSQKIEQKVELAANDLFDNIEIDLSGFHEGKPSYSVMSLLPLYDANNRNSFLQAHLSTQADVNMFNVGFVQRQGSFDNKIIFGYNLFYDLDLEHSHERWGAGADLLSSLGDVHFNYYEAITDFKTVNGSKEYTLDGYDIQIGFPLPYLPKSKLYAEIFSWNGINSSRDLQGEQYSLKSELPYGITLELGKTSYNQISKDEEFITLNINLLELKNKHKSFKYEISQIYSSTPYDKLNFSDISDRKYEKVRRENKIKKQTTRSGTVKIMGY